MRPSSVAQSGMPTGPKWMGWWGEMGGPKQRYIAQYTVSHLQTSPMQGALKQYLWGGYTRLLHQIPYFIVPFTGLYFVVKWANSKNHFLHSKQGHIEAMKAEGLH